MADDSGQHHRDVWNDRASEIVADLFRKHGDAVEAVARGLMRDAHLAADVCQAVFVKAVTRFEQIPVDAERAWLLRVASNEAIDVLRKRGREKKHTHAAALPLPLDADSGERAAVREERNRQIRRVIADLPEFDQLIVRKRFEQGQTFAEIAAAVDKPLGTVLSRAHRLMKTLESRLRDMNDD